MVETKRYFENTMHYDGYDYYVKADLNYTFEGYGKPYLDVEITSIIDENDKEVLDEFEWAVYNEFIDEITENSEY